MSCAGFNALWVKGVFGIALLTASIAASASNLFVSSLYSGIGRFDPATGTGGVLIPRSGAGPLSVAFGITVGPDGLLYVATESAGGVLRYDVNSGGLIDTFVPFHLQFPLRDLLAIQFGSDGHLYATSGFGGARVERFNGANGATLGDFVTMEANGGLAEPVSLAFTPDGNFLLVAGDLNHAVLRYRATDGAFVDAFVPTRSGGLLGAAGMTFGPDGNLYAANWDRNEILRYSGVSGEFLGSFASGNGLSLPFGLAFGLDGNLYVASAGDDRIYVFAGSDGHFLRSFAATGMDLTYGSFLVFTSAVPEPTAYVLITVGLGLVGLTVRRRRCA